VIYEAAIPLRPGLRRVTLADPSEPLEPVPCPAPPPEPEPEVTAGPEAEALREAAAARAAEEARAAREEREKLDRVLGQLLDTAHDLRAQQRNRLEEMQRVAVELALAVASHVVYERIAAGDYAVEELVRRAVTRLEPGAAVTVALHPDDLALLERRLADGPLYALDTDELRLTGDPALARGDCRAETGDVTVTTRLEEHLAEIRRDLLQALPAAEVERRKPVAEERPLRRYPDRRHTA
jgi:flagellar assembly protein FliH